MPGLTAKDFDVSEQIPPKRDHRPQSISVFRAVNWAELKAANANPASLPPGVYSNLGNQQKAQVPPTVLLFDGINTDLESQLQVHQQMVKMLGSIPADVPVAVSGSVDIPYLESHPVPTLLSEPPAGAKP